MFEVYLTEQRFDPTKQRSLALAMLGAAAALSALGMLGWTAGKLSINKVSAPRFDTLLTVPVEMTPPPPAAIPDRPAAPASGDPPAQSTEAARPSEPERNEAPIDEIGKPSPRPTPTGKYLGGGGSPGLPGTGGGGPPGMPGGMGPIGTPLTPRPPPPVSKPPVTSIAALRAVALHDPNPDPRKLRATRAGVSGRGGQVEVSFCIDNRGRVDEVRTTRRFPGDAEVDRICRDTVSAWRFRPFVVGGKPHRTCSKVSFSIEFE